MSNVILTTRIDASLFLKKKQYEEKTEYQDSKKSKLLQYGGLLEEI